MSPRVHTNHNPPVIIERDGQLYVEITLTDNAIPLGFGEWRDVSPIGDVVRAPIGDGRQFAARVLDMIVLPAIAPRVGDPVVKWPPPYSSPND